MVQLEDPNSLRIPEAAAYMKDSPKGDAARGRSSWDSAGEIPLYQTGMGGFKDVDYESLGSWNAFPVYGAGEVSAKITSENPRDIEALAHAFREVGYSIDQQATALVISSPIDLSGVKMQSMVDSAPYLAQQPNLTPDFTTPKAGFNECIPAVREAMLKLETAIEAITGVDLSQSTGNSWSKPVFRDPPTSGAHSQPPSTTSSVIDPSIENRGK